MMDIEKLQQKARLSYEIGRLAAAAKSLVIMVPILLIAVLMCTHVKTTLLAGFVLMLTTIALKWRGQNFNHGANVGMFGGLMGFLLPVGFHAVGLCCQYDAEVAICVTSGLIMGSFVSWRAAIQAPNSISFFAAAAGVSILTGLLGCLSLGVGGIVGLIAGMLIAVAPYAIVRTMRQA